MAQTIKLKRSNTADNIPETTQVDFGEMAINTRDGLLWTIQDTDGAGTKGLITVLTENNSIQDLSDVHSMSPSDGDVLTYDDTNGWQAETLDSSGSPVVTVVDFTADASQDTFVTNYNTDNVEVYSSGVKLRSTEYTATNGTSVVLDQELDIDTWVQVRSNTDSPGATVPWGSVTGTPDNISGYGITDAMASTGDLALVTTGTITTGTWEATPVTDTYISSASTWSNKQDPETTISGYGITDAYDLVSSDSVCDVDYNAMKIEYNVSGSDACTGTQYHNGLLIDVNNNATGGTGANEHIVQGIWVDYNGLNSTTSDKVRCFYADCKSNQTAGTTEYLSGSFNRIIGANTGGNISNVYGCYSTSIDLNEGTVSHLGAGHFLCQKQSTGTAVTATATGVHGEVQIDEGAGVITSAVAVNAIIDNNVTTSPEGAIGTAYLFQGTYEGTIPTNAYGIYIGSAVDNYLGGNLEVNTNLDIGGDLSVTGEVTGNLDIGGDLSVTGEVTGEVNFAGVSTYNYTSTSTNIDLSNGNSFYINCTANLTQTFSNIPSSGKTVIITLELYDAGDFTITWDSSINWANGTVPTFTSDGTDIVTMYTRDSGTNWHASAQLGYA